MSTKKKAKKKAAAKKPAAKKAAKKKTAAKKKPAAKKAPAKKSASGKKAPAKKTAKKSTAKPAVKSSAKSSTAKSGGKSRSASNKDFTDFIPYEEKHGEDYMNDAQQDHFRNILRTWKQELMEEVDRTVHHMQDEAANFPDPNDRATQESEFTMELRTRDRERKLIKKIDESLEKIDNGEYGYCEECGIEIGVRRLEARPTATLCIDCKSLDEIREKQRY
jgi:DnaK suppressor protein